MVSGEELVSRTTSTSTSTSTEVIDFYQERIWRLEIRGLGDERWGSVSIEVRDRRFDRVDVYLIAHL